MSIYALILTALLNAAVLWKPEKTLLTILTGLVSLVYGLRLAGANDTGSVLWITGAVIGIYGTSMIFIPIIEVMKPVIKKWREKGAGQ